MQNFEQGYFKNPEEKEGLQNEIEIAIHQKIVESEQQLDQRIEALKTQLGELNDRIMVADMQEDDNLYKGYIENLQHIIADTREQIQKIGIPIETIKASSLNPEMDQSLKILEDRKTNLENRLQDLLIDIERAYEVPSKEEYAKWKDKAEALNRELEDMYSIGDEEKRTGFSLN